ncbi:aldehyde ferredoxin oxidoreductase C-terminal domain-containing protein, partial [Candidatus Bipolaricaulota bacterium]|nr:aldehyde ferredoxin oxidoreductase C-terminal domain-containing protein [Candidatus Bipolaricaulota bacterium]
EIHDPERLRELTKESYKDISNKDGYDFWTRQGTMQVFSYCNENSLLPTRNFSEGQFEDADRIDGFAMEKEKVDRRGCPNCNMQCGNVIEDSRGHESELDYENVGMLGPNLGMTDMQEIGTLNRICDEYGLDTISTGSSIAFAMELAEKGLLDEDFGFGDFEAARQLIGKIANREGLGDHLANGTKRMAEEVGQGSEKFAMHVKGLEISAYDCHALPGMALGYGTSSIGGHHKDCWVIGWELENDRFGYTDRKIEEIINLQRKRGGVFEAFTVCRLPWVELGFSLDWYEKFFEAATGESLTWDYFNEVADRLYTVIRSIMVRERGENWDIETDVPPDRWFDEPLSKGNLQGQSLDREKYIDMLKRYYQARGWDSSGRPTQETLDKLELDFIEL